MNKWQELIRKRLTDKGVDLSNPGHVAAAIAAAKKKDQTEVVAYLQSLQRPESDPELEALLNA
jgi:hypothetical protein